MLRSNGSREMIIDGIIRNRLYRRSQTECACCTNLGSRISHQMTYDTVVRQPPSVADVNAEAAAFHASCADWLLHHFEFDCAAIPVTDFSFRLARYMSLSSRFEARNTE